jgi:hypothetical protein
MTTVCNGACAGVFGVDSAAGGVARCKLGVGRVSSPHPTDPPTTMKMDNKTTVRERDRAHLMSPH